MANASGFVDFNQYSDLNRDEETRMLEEAMARAEAAQANAEGKLRQSGREAQGRYGEDGQYAGEAANISETASYGDYLSAKGEAAAAWAAVTAQSRNPYAQALRGSIRAERGMGGAGDAAGGRMDAMEAKYGDEVTARRSGQERMRGEAAVAAEAKKKAAEEKTALDQQNKSNHYNALFAKFAKPGNDSGGPNGYAAGDRTGWARQLSGAVDSGDWSLDAYGESTGGAFNPEHKRGIWGSAIEGNAWGSSKDPGNYWNPAKTNKKGTAY